MGAGRSWNLGGLGNKQELHDIENDRCVRCLVATATRAIPCFGSCPFASVAPVGPALEGADPANVKSLKRERPFISCDLVEQLTEMNASNAAQ